MGKLYDFQYFGTESKSSTGQMICGACGKRIEPGEVEWRSAKRNKRGDWHYVTHHRACCSDDAGWKKWDKEGEDARRAAAEFLDDALAFLRKWGIKDLEDTVDELYRTGRISREEYERM